MRQMEAFHCEGDAGAQPLHCHEEVEFVAVYQGRGLLQYGRFRHATGPGVFSIVCPHETHAGTPLAPEFAVRALNVSAEWFADAQLDWRLLWRRQPLSEDAGGLAAFLLAYEAVRQNLPLLHQEQSLLALCSAVNGYPALPVGAEPQRIKQAALLLRERFTEEISLIDLAATVGLSPSYLCRAFKKSIGLSPHAYQISLRVARAKSLLAHGETPADVAGAVGFYDQSHLTLHFKRLLGTTPAGVARRAIFSYKSSSRQE